MGFRYIFSFPCINAEVQEVCYVGYIVFYQELGWPYDAACQLFFVWLMESRRKGNKNRAVGCETGEQVPFPALSLLCDFEQVTALLLASVYHPVLSSLGSLGADTNSLCLAITLSKADLLAEAVAPQEKSPMPIFLAQRG